MAIAVEDLKKLSPRNRVLIVLGVCLLLGYFYYMFFFQSVLDKRITLGAKLTELQKQVDEKERVAAQAVRFFREIDSLKASFKTALLKLPDRQEMPALLDSVSMAGKKSGVDFLLFEPKVEEKPLPKVNPAAPAKPADEMAGEKAPKTAAAKTAGQPVKPAGPEKFYDEILVKMQISGDFQNTLSFFNEVGRLPRIINIEQIEIAAPVADAKGKGGNLKTSCIMKTYMFVEKKKP